MKITGILKEFNRFLDDLKEKKAESERRANESEINIRTGNEIFEEAERNGDEIEVIEYEITDAEIIGVAK